MRHRGIVYVVGIAVIASALAACSTSNQAGGTPTVAAPSSTTTQSTAMQPQTKSGPLKIAYIPIVMNTQYTMTLNGMKEQIDRLGGASFATIDVQAPTSNDSSLQEQPDIMENVISTGVDAIVLSTEDEKAMLPYIQRAEEAGIAVFLTNMAETDPSDSYFVSNVGYSQYDASHLIGEWTVSHFAGKDAKLAVLEGYPGLLNDQRLQGFQDAIKDASNLQIVASQPADWTRAKGQEVTENILQAHPDVNMIYGMYDEMALGAVASIKAAGELDKVVVAGYDNTADGNASIKAGELTVTVDTGSKQVGVELVKAISDFLTQGKAVDHDIMVEPKVYDSSNIASFDTEDYSYVPRQPEK